MAMIINWWIARVIQMKTKAVKETPEEITVTFGDVKFIKHLPTCPKCKRTDDVFYFNVTKKIYECTKCNLRYHFA
jgi:ribosomal protein L37AE/L43A